MTKEQGYTVIVTAAPEPFLATLKKRSLNTKRLRNNPDKARPSIGNGLPIFHANDKLLPIYDLNASKRACGSNGGC